MERESGERMPVCPSPERMRELYRLPPEAIDALDEADRAPTEAERKSSCPLVSLWSAQRRVALDVRVQTCEQCPRHIRPRSTRLYARVVRHLELKEAGFQMRLDDYTPREIAAIRVVQSEMACVRSERLNEARHSAG
jgi:hypothetical protein